MRSKRFNNIHDAFWAKVAKAGPDDCWLWTASRQGQYGCIGYAGKRERAHRISWMLNNGPIPAGMDVMHKCDNPLCVNPNHLQLGTHAENMHDRDRKGRCISPPGELCGRAKLTWDDVNKIRTDYANGISRRQLAEEHHVNVMTIRQIVLRLTWK